MFNLIFTCLACAGLAFGANNIDKVQYQSNDNVVFHQGLKRNATYNDESYKITLTVDELNNYTWDNFADLGLTDSDLGDTYASYGQYLCNYIGDLYFAGNNDQYQFMIPNVDSDNKFIFYDDANETDFVYDVVLELDSILYASIKTAIQADIDANQTPVNDDYAGALGDFVSIMVAGLQNFGAGVANGLAAFASALFLATDSGGNVTGLSIFGGIIAIFAGLALAVGITTRVYLWVTSLGK